jgi:hypothetical protein
MRSPSITPLDARMHHRQASVAFQVSEQPLLLPSMFRQDIINNVNSASRNSASSSSLHRRSSLFKRDSAVSLQHAGSRSDVRRISMRRSFQSSEATFVANDLADFLAEQPAQIWVQFTVWYVQPLFLPPFLPPSFGTYRVSRTEAAPPSTTPPKGPGVEGLPVLWRENAVAHQRDRLNIEPMGESTMGDQILLISRDLRFRPNAA